MPIYLQSPQPGPPGGLLSRILTAIVAAVLLVLFFIIAFPVFLALLVIVIIGGAVFSWKFRKIRREMESVMREAGESSAPFPGAGEVPPGATVAGSNSYESQRETLEGEFEVIKREE